MAIPWSCAGLEIDQFSTQVGLDITLNVDNHYLMHLHLMSEPTYSSIRLPAQWGPPMLS